MNTRTQTQVSDRLRWLRALLILASVLWIYSPAFHGTWLMDDELYLPKNPLLHDPARLWKIWFAPGDFIEYYPVEETLQWAQWQLWGNNTLGYHLSNVLLHALNALLVWRLLGKLGLRLAWVGGLLFAVHPVMVETVAWIVEFKNTLSLAPFLLALCAWTDYEEQRRSRDYFLALGLFLVAMLCKISMAPFPVVILLYAWWKRERIGWGDLKAAAPFFALSLTLGLTTWLAGNWFLELHHTSPDPAPIGGLLSRLACAGLAFSFYFSQFFWPVHLLPKYPQWNLDPLLPRHFLPWPILLAGAGWFWARRQTWGRHALLGGGFFLLFLGPFLGLNWISYMKISRVMDHFLYLPVIGLIGLVVAALDDLGRKLPAPARPIGVGFVALVLAGLAWQGHDYAKVFTSRTGNIAYVVAHDPLSGSRHNTLGDSLRQDGRIPEAIAEFREAVRLAPELSEAHNNLGGLLMRTGHYPEAMQEYAAALKIKPDYAEALAGLGNVYLQTGHLPEAISQYQAAIQANPYFSNPHNGLGNALLANGHLPEAEAECREALKLNPDYVEAHCTLGLVLAREGRVGEAIEEFETASRLAPDNARIARELERLKGAANTM